MGFTVWLHESEVQCFLPYQTCRLGWPFLFGFDMVHGMDVPSASEGNGKNIVGPIAMLNHYPHL